MQNKEPSSKLYIIDHDPCLDGIYSLTGLVLPILVKIRKDNWTIQQYLELLKSELSKISKKSKNHKNDPNENKNMGFFNPTIQDLCYMPIRLSEDSNEVQKIIKFLNDDSKSSILIFVDYFGRTWNNLLLLSKKFQYLVVIDHHQTCVNAISDYKICKELTIYLCQLPETEPLQMAIMRRRLQFDVRQNPAIFYKLLEFDLVFQLKKENNQLFKEIRKLKIQLSIVGYALYCDDLSIMNQLGNALGILAMRSGDKKLGADYHDDNSNYTQYKINLRSAHHDENEVLLNRFRCDVLAESFGGGGHVGAASLNMKKKEQKKLMSE